VSTLIDDLDSLLAQELDDAMFQLKAPVIASDGDAHGCLSFKARGLANHRRNFLAEGQRPAENILRRSLTSG
jgi:hypothetical protein